MNKALCYCRVSTKEQADSGYSLEGQVIETQKYAQSIGYEIFEVIAEDVSGSVPMDQRPKGKKIRGFVKAHEIDAIIVYCVDRLSRELVDMLVDARFWLRAGIRLFFVDKGEVRSENDILFIMQGWQSTDEKKKIVGRLAKGRKDKAANKNLWVGSGTVPYGYLKIGKMKDAKIEINPEEAGIVKWIFETYTGKNGQRLNLFEISEQLTADGIPAPGLAPTRRGRSSRWWKPTIQGIIKNSIYIGKAVYAGIIIDNPRLAILDENTFTRANEQLQINFQQAARRRKFDYLLAGRLLCTCGRPMFGATNLVRIYKYKYYRCILRSKGDHTTCRAPALLVDNADDKAWNWIYNTLLNPEELDRGLTRMDQKLASENEYKQERLSQVVDMLDRVSGKINKLMKAFQDETDEFISESYQDQIKQLGLQRKALLHNKESLETDINRNSLTPQRRQEILTLAAKIKERLGDASFKNKRRLMEMLDITFQLMGDEKRYWLEASCKFSEDVSNSVIELL